MLDVATRMMTFLQNNDSARVQMHDSQVKQAICLINPEHPFIRTGLEEQYLPYSSYLYVAKDDGKVIYKDDIIMIVKYKDNTGEIIKIDSLYGNKEGFDKILITNLNQDDTFYKDQILARHSSVSEDGFLTMGCNLKTTYISHPYNFKDALIISETCAKKMSTRIIYEESIDCQYNIPIIWKDNNISYNQGTYVNKGDTIFIIKDRFPNNPMNIVSSGDKVLAPVSGKLYYDIKVDEIVKTRNEEDFYNNLYKNQIAKEEIIAQKIREIYNQDDDKEVLKAEAYINYYCPQLNKRRTGRNMILTYWIVRECPVIRGCKLTNRHGNKGVVARIYPDEKMPMDKYGQYADIVLSSMCCTSRMNVGQLFELHINRANNLYTTNVLNDSTLSTSEKISKLQEMIFSAQPNYVNQTFKEYIDSYDDNQKEEFLNKVKEHNIIQIVQPPFTKFNYEDCFKFCKKYGNMDDDLKEDLVFDGENIRASFGHTYWYRLEHEPDKKYFARSTGLYGKIGQPSKNDGGTNKGAHRIGELETWGLLAHQAYENLLEFFVSKSDSISEAARMLKYVYDDIPDKYTPFVSVPGILKIFRTFVNAAGYDMVEIDDGDDREFIEQHSNIDLTDISIPIDNSIDNNFQITESDSIDGLDDIDKELDLLK